MKGPARAAALLAAMLTASAGHGAERFVGIGACAAGAPFAAVIADAVDGDTLRLADGRLARLAGIEAVKADPGLAAAARARLAGLVSGRTMALAAIGTADRYGRLRTVARPADGGLPVQEILVAEGLARLRAVAAEFACLPGIAAAERSARAARRNLWSRPQFGIRRADDPSLLAQNGLYELVEGRVVSVGRRSRVVFLDFGRIWRQDFTVMMDTSVAGGMAKAGVTVESLVGRMVRVRGTLEQNGGPAIRVDDLGAIELLDE